MTVPSLPAALNPTTGGVGGDDIDNSWVDDVRDLLEWFRDTRPMLFAQRTSQSVSTGSTTDVDFSDGAGAFTNTPLINVGSWSASNPEDDIDVPENGVYAIAVRSVAAANATGVRRSLFSLNSTAQPETAATKVNPGSGADTRLGAMGLYYLTTSDRIGMRVHQSSGGNLNIDSYLYAVWIASSTS